MPAFAKVKMAQVACGSDHVLALTTTGHIYVWGNGSQSQLGRRVLDRRRTNGLHPERMGLRNIVHVAAGQYHSFAIDEKGTVYGWGLNTFHQLGISSSKGGDGDMIITPTPIDALSPSEHNGSRVIQIEGGEHHSLFLFDNGEVWACGRSDASQCGIAKDHPAQEGLKERRDEIKAEKKLKVDQAQEKLAKLEADGKTEEEKTEAMTDLAAAQASFAAALDEYIPEPVRVSLTC
jgi:regulator of chromosome condensation